MIRHRRRRTHLAIYTRSRISRALSWRVRVVRLVGALVLVIGALGSTGLLAAARSLAVASGTLAVTQTFGAGNATGGSTLSASPSTTTTTGDLLVAVIRTRSSSGSIQPVTSVTDSNGETWSRAADRASGQGDQSTWYFAGALSLSASQSVTVTAGTATTTAIAFTVLAVAGATGSPLDVTATNTGSSQSASTGSTATTTQASEVAIADLGWNGTGSASGPTPGYTVVGAQTSTVTNTKEAEQAAWQTLSTTGAQAFGATLSSSVSWAGAIATFKLGSTGPAPVISSFTPAHGTDSTAVTITGTGFSNGTPSVTFNGTPAVSTAMSDTQINTSVPAGATTGPVTVATSGGIASSSTAFTVDPAITGFSPTSGPVGASVTISGSGFTGATAVVFNATHQPTFTVTSDSQITATVPTGATSGPISVTTPANTATSSTSFTVTVAPAEPHVMLIVEENQEYGSIIGNSNAPYINTLATSHASATNWYAVQHNSAHDYLELLSGSDQGLGTTPPPYSATTLVDELHSNAIPWKGYMESMPSTPCFKGTPPSDGLYRPDHNPFHDFTKYTTNSGGWCSSTNLGSEGVLTYPGSSSLVSTLDAANPPDFVWITPNQCDNMHGDTNTGSPCASSTHGQLVKAGDSWLSNNIASVISSSWFSQNGIIIITWDEGTTKAGCCSLSAPGGHIATIVVTTNNAGLGNFTGTGDHYGTLAAIENAYGVSLLLNSASGVNGDLAGAFGP